MKLLSRLDTAVRAVYWLGAPALLRNALYRFGLLTGHFRRVTPLISPAGQTGAAALLHAAAERPCRPIVTLPEPETLRWMMEEGAALLMAEAREIMEGRVRLYGAEPVPLDLNPHTPPVHWTQAQNLVTGDIKDIWEPARMGWVFPLGRAYRLTGDEHLSQAFWEGFETFQRLNPYNIGPNWASGQEIALRILSMGFGWQVFQESPHSTPERLFALVSSIYEHACRLPVTMIYARSQQNNHLISEAAGLLTAGWLLPELPQSARWQKTGWHTLNQALEQQIATDGTYMQQSINYHRLMLDAALWAFALEQRMSESGNLTEITAELGYTQKTHARLSAAACWLAAQVDPVSGACPNLGANDGARILPLAGSNWHDYRPTAQAACLAFDACSAMPAGPWDEQSLWLGLALPKTRRQPAWPEASGIYRLGDADSWATMRAVRFHSRPSQADQLHVDLWHHGLNLAVDAGTCRYNDPAPWDNALARTAAHNTVTVDGMDQMKRAGRFLWLDWAHARTLPDSNNIRRISAEHDGYRRLGILHRRTLERVSNREWQVTDHLLPVGARAKEHRFTLHWLVQDWPFTVDDAEPSIQLETPAGPIVLQILLKNGNADMQPETGFSIVRAGETVCGAGEALPIHGWWSPVYSKREPALSILLSVCTAAPLEFQSRWIINA